MSYSYLFHRFSGNLTLFCVTVIFPSLEIVTVFIPMVTPNLVVSVSCPFSWRKNHRYVHTCSHMLGYLHKTMRCRISINPFWYLLTISVLYIFLFKQLEIYNSMCLDFQHINGVGRLKPSPMQDPTMTGPYSKDHWANMGSTLVLSAPDGSHVGPMNLAERASIQTHIRHPVLNRQGVVLTVYDKWVFLVHREGLLPLCEQIIMKWCNIL